MANNTAQFIRIVNSANDVIATSSNITIPDTLNNVFLEADDTAGNIEVTMPATPFPGQQVVVVKIKMTGNQVKVLPNAGHTIANSTAGLLRRKNTAIRFTFFNSNWQPS